MEVRAMECKEEEKTKFKYVPAATAGTVAGIVSGASPLATLGLVGVGVAAQWVIENLGKLECEEEEEEREEKRQRMPDFVPRLSKPKVESSPSRKAPRKERIEARPAKIHRGSHKSVPCPRLSASVRDGLCFNAGSGKNSLCPHLERFPKAGCVHPSKVKNRDTKFRFEGSLDKVVSDLKSVAEYLNEDIEVAEVDGKVIIGARIDDSIESASHSFTSDFDQQPELDLSFDENGLNVGGDIEEKVTIGLHGLSNEKQPNFFLEYKDEQAGQTDETPYDLFEENQVEESFSETELAGASPNNETLASDSGSGDAGG
jgi:hypothetical protein